MIPRFTVARFGFLLLLLALSPATLAQFSQYYGDPPEGNADPAFPKDVFTFVRIRYSTGGGDSGYGWGRRGRDWRTDYPDAEWNLAYRLMQMTSLRVNPEGKVLRLTDSDLFNYPFIYIVEPGNLRFSEAERKALSRYLLNGGFLMVDDFWGEAEWENFRAEMELVFPGREPEELDVTHAIFNIVFELKEKPQIPNVQRGTWSQFDGVTWERPDAQTPHYMAIKDDHGRVMVIICHNTDLGDGWEREGDNIYYFREFSEKKAYPLGINIIFYAMTH